MFEFLQDYIEGLPQEVREDTEFGFQLEDGLSSDQIEAIGSEIHFRIPNELMNFYRYANGG